MEENIYLHLKATITIDKKIAFSHFVPRIYVFRMCSEFSDPNQVFLYLNKFFPKKVGP
jgi:hypothetical protein